MDSVGLQFQHSLILQLVVAAGYALVATRHGVGLLAGLVQCLVAIPGEWVCALFTFQFAAPIVPIVVATAVGWAVAAIVVKALVPRRAARPRWLLYWLVGGTAVSTAGCLVYPQVSREPLEWFHVDAKFR